MPGVQEVGGMTSMVDLQQQQQQQQQHLHHQSAGPSTHTNTLLQEHHMDQGQTDLSTQFLFLFYKFLFGFALFCFPI